MSWRHISRVYDTSQKKYTVKDTERLTNLTKESQWAKEWTKLGQWSDNRGGKELWTSTRLGTLTRDNYGTPKNERINDVDDIIFDEQIAGNTFFFPWQEEDHKHRHAKAPGPVERFRASRWGWIALETSETLSNPHAKAIGICFPDPKMIQSLQMCFWECVCLKMGE